MEEPHARYVVTYDKPIEGIVIKRQCKHCNHDTEVGIQTEDRRFIPFLGGEIVTVFGRDVNAIEPVPSMIQEGAEDRIPYKPLSAESRATLRQEIDDTLNFNYKEYRKQLEAQRSGESTDQPEQKDPDQ